jgi:hypothetical protein
VIGARARHGREQFYPLFLPVPRAKETRIPIHLFRMPTTMRYVNCPFALSRNEFPSGHMSLMPTE